ncbi:MAG: hypothetical protein HQL52_05525 [Magnetococcales bacterium]|nr:hypothetical protein [Magnetococcales bacterium]
MNKTTKTRFSPHHWGRRTLMAAALMVLTGCNANLLAESPPEGIGYRQARFAEIGAMQSFRDCRDQALDLDSQARTTGSQARWLASARLLERCEADLGPQVAGLSQEERMRAYALGIVNYIKGGDLATAAANVQRFEEAFDGNDLYFTDGSSFTDSMKILISQTKPNEFPNYTLLNAPEPLKDEIRRVDYWSRN